MIEFDGPLLGTIMLAFYVKVDLEKRRLNLSFGQEVVE